MSSRFFSVVVLASCLSILAPSLSAQEGEVVRDVIIVGQVGVDHRLLKSNLGTRIGQPYKKSIVEEDMLWLHDEYGLIVDDVLVDPGPVVRFILQRIVRYDWIVLEGNDRYGEATLRHQGRLRDGRGGTPDEVVKARTLIREYYLKRGHHFVQVDVRPGRDELGDQGATIVVFEGPQVDVDDYTIEGLTALSQGAAFDVISSAPGFWSWLVGKDFVRASVDRDVVVLEQFVRGEGYLDAQVALGPLQWSDDREDVDVTLLVDEGERYMISSLTVEGNTEFTQEELLADARLAVGKPYRTHDRARLLRSIRAAYGNAGFIEARLDIEEIFALDSADIDVVVKVEEGHKKRVRDVIVRGNVNTRDGVVRRYMTVYPGDVVDLRELRYSEDALVALDYFTDLTGVPKVRVATEPTDDPELVDVVIDIEDTSSGLFTFIVGAGSDNGVFAGVTVDKRNFDISRPATSWSRFFPEFFGAGEAFHGGGQRLFMELSPGTEQSTFDVLFQDPWLDESEEKPWGLSVELYKRRRFFREYTRTGTGAGVFLEHRYSRESSISIGPRIEDVRISDIDNPEVSLGGPFAGQQTAFAKAAGTHRRHVLEGAWSYNSVDSLYEPTEGFTTRVSVESVGGVLGGDVDALHVDLVNEWFVPIGEDDEGNVRVFHPKLSVGLVEPTDGDEIPFFENIFAGGSSGPFAVRGFDFQGIGPREEIQFVPGTLLPILVKEDGEAVGGRLAIAGSLEALFPLVTEYNPFRDREEILIKGVVFVDAGNLVEKASLNDLLKGFRVSTGAGIRMRLPALGGVILLLDWAQVLSKQEGDETRALSFELTRRF